MAFPPLCDPVEQLSAAELARTARHLALAGFGEISQRRLAAAHVAVVGAGGLGSPVVMALAAAGVGTITIIDDDLVEASNLQRQVMHRHQDVGVAKVDSARRAATEIAPEVQVITRRERLDQHNAQRLLAGTHLVLDGTDSFATRAAVASACEALGLPLVWGVIQEFNAQVTVFWSAPPTGIGPVVLADLYPPQTVGELPSCAQVGVLGALCLQVGGLMSSEAIKLLVGIGEPLLGRVAVIDVLTASQTIVPLRPAQSSHTPVPASPPHLALPDAAARISHGASWLDVREPHEVATSAIPGAIQLPLSELFAHPERVGAQEVVVVCHSGARAHSAASVLQQHGVRACVLAGGIMAWQTELEQVLR